MRKARFTGEQMVAELEMTRRSDPWPRSAGKGRDMSFPGRQRN
jgi:hypothetical protein